MAFTPVLQAQDTNEFQRIAKRITDAYDADNEMEHAIGSARLNGGAYLGAGSNGRSMPSGYVTYLKENLLITSQLALDVSKQNAEKNVNTDFLSGAHRLTSSDILTRYEKQDFSTRLDYIPVNGRILTFGIIECNAVDVHIDTAGINTTYRQFRGSHRAVFSTCNHRRLRLKHKRQRHIATSILQLALAHIRSCERSLAVHTRVRDNDCLQLPHDYGVVLVRLTIRNIGCGKHNCRGAEHLAQCTHSNLLFFHKFFLRRYYPDQVRGVCSQPLAARPSWAPPWIKLLFCFKKVFCFNCYCL